MAFIQYCYSDRRAEERAAYELERSAKEVQSFCNSIPLVLFSNL